MKRSLSVLAAALLISHDCEAIIIIPIPNLAFPTALGKIRDALENSTETKALATAGEDKIFGGKQWVWGQAAGKMTQADADDLAMRRCEASLANQKSQTAGGQPLYNFGSKRCELYKFAHITVNLPDPVVPPAAVQIQAPTSVAAPTPVAGQAPAPAEVPASNPIAAQAPAAVIAPIPAEPPAASVTPSAPPPSASAATPAPSVQQTQPKGTTDIVQKIWDLDTLYKQNLITKAEYEQKKKQLLDAL